MKNLKEGILTRVRNGPVRTDRMFVAFGDRKRVGSKSSALRTQDCIPDVSSAPGTVCPK